MDLTVDLVREWLAANKEDEKVKGFLSELSPAPKLTADLVKPWLEEADGKAFVQPLMDKRVGDALKTYKENHYANDLKAAVAAEILKLNPQETPEQKRIRELEDRVQKQDSDRAKSELRTQVLREAQSLAIPTWWVDDYSGNTIEEARVRMQQIKQDTDAQITKGINEKLSTGFKPGSGNGKGDEPKIDPTKMTVDEAIKLELEGKLNSVLSG